MNNIIQVSFKNNLEDKMLIDWLEYKFIEHRSKSNYIKSILNKEMKAELKKEKKEDTN